MILHPRGTSTRHKLCLKASQLICVSLNRVGLTKWSLHYATNLLIAELGDKFRKSLPIKASDVLLCLGVVLLLLDGSMHEKWGILNPPLCQWCRLYHCLFRCKLYSSTITILLTSIAEISSQRYPSHS